MWLKLQLPEVAHSILLLLFFHFCMLPSFICLCFLWSVDDNVTVGMCPSPSSLLLPFYVYSSLNFQLFLGGWEERSDVLGEEEKIFKPPFPTLPPPPLPHMGIM